MKPPPTAEELVGPPPWCLDSECALKNFLGKSVDEAQEMCRTAAYVTEDFTYMAPGGLIYYLPAALNYLIGEESQGDWEFAQGLLSSLCCQVFTMRVQGPALSLIQQIAKFCAANRAKFDLRDDELICHDILREIRRVEN